MSGAGSSRAQGKCLCTFHTQLLALEPSILQPPSLNPQVKSKHYDTRVLLAFMERYPILDTQYQLFETHYFGDRILQELGHYDRVQTCLTTIDSQSSTFVSYHVFQDITIDFISTCQEWDPSGGDVDSKVEDKEEDQVEPLLQCMVSFFLLGQTQRMRIFDFNVLLGFETTESIQIEDYQMVFVGSSGLGIIKKGGLN